MTGATGTTLLTWLALCAVTVGTGARLARLLVHETFPPTARLRVWYIGWTAGKGDWGDLATCHYCMAAWTTLAAWGAGWGALGLFGSVGWPTFFWFPAGWLTLAYLAAILVTYDGSD